MPWQSATRRQFLKRSMVFVPVAASIEGLSHTETVFGGGEEEERLILGPVQTPVGVRQTDILFDPTSYTAFPHVVRLDGDELLIAFRQAPRQEQVRHTHPRSVITVMRSYGPGRDMGHQERRPVCCRRRTGVRPHLFGSRPGWGFAGDARGRSRERGPKGRT